MAKGEYDKVYEKKNAATVAEHEAALKVVQGQANDNKTLADTLQATLVSTVREGGISSAFVASEADKSQLRSVHAIARDSVLVKGELLPVVEVDISG